MARRGVTLADQLSFDSNLLIESARQLGLALTPRQTAALRDYAAMLRQWNQRVRLVADASPDVVLRKHIVDSLACVMAGCLDRSSSIVDIGAGAGLPGIPLAIALGAPVTLVEATRKKAMFLEAAATALRLDNACVVHGRAEDLGRSQLRESFDCAIARGVAPLEVVLEYCLPLVRVGGCAVAQKGRPGEKELSAGAAAAGLLGGGSPRLVELETREVVGAARCLVVVDKILATPARFPRKPGIPRKRPLGRSTST